MQPHEPKRHVQPGQVQRKPPTRNRWKKAQIWQRPDHCPHVICHGKQNLLVMVRSLGEPPCPALPTLAQSTVFQNKITNMTRHDLLRPLCKHDIESEADGLATARCNNVYFNVIKSLFKGHIQLKERGSEFKYHYYTLLQFFPQVFKII